MTVQNPAPANPGQPAAPAPSAPAGMFDSMAIIEPTQPLERPPLDPDPVLATTLEPTKEPEVNADGTPKTAEPPAPARLYANRFKTPEDLEKAYGESSSEGLRLYQENRAIRDEGKTLQNKIDELNLALEEAKKTPAFQEMSLESLKELASTDPLKAAEYVAEKKLRERDAALSKKEREAELARQKRESAESEAYINDRIDAMRADPKNYPDYESLQTLQSEMLKRMGHEIAGKKWAPDFLYYASYGYKAMEAHRKGKTAETEAEAKAKAQAKAQAAAGGSAGAGPATKAPGSEADDNSDKAFINRLLVGAPKPMFS